MFFLILRLIKDKHKVPKAYWKYSATLNWSVGFALAPTSTDVWTEEKRGRLWTEGLTSWVRQMCPTGNLSQFYCCASDPFALCVHHTAYVTLSLQKMLGFFCSLEDYMKWSFKCSILRSLTSDWTFSICAYTLIGGHRSACSLFASGFSPVSLHSPRTSMPGCLERLRARVREWMVSACPGLATFSVSYPRGTLAADQFTVGRHLLQFIPRCPYFEVYTFQHHCCSWWNALWVI